MNARRRNCSQLPRTTQLRTPAECGPAQLALAQQRRDSIETCNTDLVPHTERQAFGGRIPETQVDADQQCAPRQRKRKRQDSCLWPQPSTPARLAKGVGASWFAGEGRPQLVLKLRR